MTHTADVVICGAGIAGVSVAYHLAVEHGLKNIVLVDERQPQDDPFNKRRAARQQVLCRLDDPNVSSPEGDGVIQDLLWRKVGAPAFTSGLNYSQPRRKQKPQAMCLRLMLCEARKRVGWGEGLGANTCYFLRN